MAVSRRRFVKGLAAGAALPAAGLALPGGLTDAAGAQGTLPAWDPAGPGGTFALDREMTTDTTTPALDLVPSGGAEAGGGRRGARALAVAPFTMLGVTISGVAGGARVRARLADGWSPWLPLVPDTGHGPDAGEGDHPASAPIWFGGATGWELDLDPGATAVALHLVRPTARRAEVTSPAPATGTEAAGTEGAEATYRVPSIRPRSAWGAAPYRGTVDTADGLRLAVVHHTVNGNGYSTASVPSMLRSIQSYHQNSRGWDDIGYNFVLDRFGRVWEGRARSRYEPVIGAHAKDVNTGSVGTAYLGDGTSTRLSAAAVASLGKLLGWKLRLHNGRPRTTNIKGHRDVGQTSCPGNTVYTQLGAVRSKAIALQPPDGPFFDVPEADARARHLTWGRVAGVIEPLPDGTFAPDVRASRGDTIFWLWRLAGSPASGAPHGFTDIPAGAHYRTAVRWGRQKGILTLPGDRRFRPDAATNRQALAQWLWRYAGQPDPSVDHGYGDANPGSVLHDWSDAYALVPGATFAGGTVLPRHEAVKLLWRMRRFDDVTRTSPFAAATTWAKYHVLVGTAATARFQPGDPLQRRHAVTWLWRLLDRPSDPTPPDHPFADVPGTAAYDAALDWAAAAGWVEGTTPTTFAPGTTLTRGDAVTWLWRAAGRTAPTADAGYGDVADDDGDLDLAVDWATEHGLLAGYGNNTFRPANPITRGPFVRAMHRLAKTEDAWSVPPPSTVLF